MSVDHCSTKLFRQEISKLQRENEVLKRRLLHEGAERGKGNGSGASTPREELTDRSQPSGLRM